MCVSPTLTSFYFIDLLGLYTLCTLSESVIRFSEILKHSRSFDTDNVQTISLFMLRVINLFTSDTSVTSVTFSLDLLPI